MNTTSVSAKATDPPTHVTPIASLSKEEELMTPGSLNLSPERISDGASTTTKVLEEILTRDRSGYRDWGINE